MGTGGSFRCSQKEESKDRNNEGEMINQRIEENRTERKMGEFREIKKSKPRKTNKEKLKNERKRESNTEKKRLRSLGGPIYFPFATESINLGSIPGPTRFSEK
jgi:hypothetical protein